MVKLLRRLVAFGPRFWLFFVGVALVAIGAAQIHPALAWLLAGLFIIWDVTRPPPAAPYRGPNSPR